MTRFATDDEVARWQTEGWVLLDGLIGTDEVDAALDDVFLVFPRPEKFHADPARYIPPGRSTEDLRRGHPKYPETGPAFRPEQHRWGREFPFFGHGRLNRLTVHPAIVDFMERALGSADLRLYQAQISAKYGGDANYEQPMHTDRNHSFVPPIPDTTLWHVETFLYLSDVSAAMMPTHVVDRSASRDYSIDGLYRPGDAPELFANEQPAIGPRGSLLAYRNDVFHRAVDMTDPSGARFLLNVSYRLASHDWIGYHSMQSRATHPGWDQLVVESSPRELELFGFPPPGHPVWTEELVAATAVRYPGLDVTPWRDGLT
jgi:hypothetical protein